MLAEDPLYKDRIETEIIPMTSERGKASQELYDWGRDRHGLVVLDPEGKALAVLKGHDWGGLELEKALGELHKTVGPLIQ